MKKKVAIRFIVLMFATCLFSVCGTQSKTDHVLNTAHIKFEYDTSFITITHKQCDSILHKCIHTLTTKTLKDLNNNEHSDIVRLMNTGLMHDSGDSAYFNKQLYVDFIALADKVKYLENITTIFPDWVSSRGMGFYLPKLKLELYGTPHPNSYFILKD